MKCESPLLIRNRYTGQPMYVGCRKCDCCRISIANSKALLLRNEILNGWFTFFVTLTYNNDNLPVVVSGFDGIYRKHGNGLVQIDCTDSPVGFNPVVPKNYPFKDCTGVIYYRDFQLFFKRLRKSLPNYVKFKYCILCEYGSRSKRPHAHIVFFFRERFALDNFTELVVKCWKLSIDRVTRNGVEYCDSNTATYIAGYFNSGLYSNGVFSLKSFRQKIRRSAYLTYGTSKEDKAQIKKAIQCFRDYNPYKDFKRPFEYWSTGKLGSLSLECVSKRIFDTYFFKPYGFGRLSFDNFRLLGRVTYDYRYKKLPEGFCYEPKPQNLNFIRSYERYLDLLSLPNTIPVFEDYLILFWDITISYNSCVLRRFMMTYTNDSEYLDSCYQTFIVNRRYNNEIVDIDFERKAEKFWTFMKLENKKDKFGLGSLADRHALRSYRTQYKMRLLPKHYNDIHSLLDF